MANVDNPKGFKWAYNITGAQNCPVDSCTLNGTVAAGDSLVIASGVCTIGLTTSALIHGVALQAGVTGDAILFVPALPDVVFEGQCSGTYAATSHEHVTVDIEGTTGIQEINEDSTSYPVANIVKLVPIQGNATGLNARVYFTFAASSYTGMDPKD
jgi:hypothetical protein